MLQGKTAIVTGASRGIGAAIAMKLAENGANVVLNYRSDSSLKLIENIADEIEKLGRETLIIKCDVSLFDDTKKLCAKAIERFTKIDILVNNAGITKDKLVLKMEEDDFDSVIDVNLKGTFNMTKNMYRHFSKNKSGSIINMSSVIGLTGNLGQANYAASKAGVLGFTKSMALELGARGVRVNAICPGFIDSDMTNQLNENIINEIKSKIPMKKLGTPIDVANLVSFLASDNSSYITGQSLSIDGGMVMR